MKIYNPLSLDTETDEPSFVNPDGIKWWLVAVGSHLNDKADDPKDGAVYRTLFPNGEAHYVVLHNDRLILETGNLENALFKLDENYLRRTK